MQVDKHRQKKLIPHSLSVHASSNYIKDYKLGNKDPDPIKVHDVVSI